MSVSDLSPIHQGDLDPPWTWNLVDGQGNTPNLSNVTPSQMALFLRNLDSGIVAQGAGTFSITQPGTLGQAVYAPANPDTEVPGRYRVWVRWLAGGVAGAFQSCDEQDLVIQGTF